MKVNLDVLSDWLISFGFGADMSFITPAPLELLYPVAKAWHRRERARGEDSSLDFWIGLLQEEQRWEEFPVDVKIQDLYQIVQLRGTKIVGVVRAQVDSDTVIVEYGNDVKLQIIVPKVDLLVLDGIVFDLGQNGQSGVSHG